MARFALDRDIEFFNSISRELVDDVIETAVQIFKLNIYDSKTNLYGESIGKWYKQGVNVNCIIGRDGTTAEYDEFGPDTSESVEFRFNKFSLREKTIYPEIGDIIRHDHRGYFEVTNVREDQLVGGRTGKQNPKENFSIVCETVMVRRSSLNIEERVK